MQLCETIYKSITAKPSDTRAYFDFIEAARGIREAGPLNRKVRALIAKEMRQGGLVGDLYEAYCQSLLVDAPFDFDAYMSYMEIDRPPQERFYQPRKKQLKPIVEALQMLEDDELDELFLSMPPRVGKTTLTLFYVTWLIGKHPEASNLYITFSDGVAKVFYSGILEIITDPITYHWKNVFPHSPLVSKNAADYTVNIKKKNRYPSITCRSIDGTLNGACDCSGLLIGDDLCSGYEEAISKDRMIRLWGKVDNNMLPRAKQTAKHLWIGTRWSVIDPEGLRISLLESDKKFEGVRYKVVNVPALDAYEESNFDYDYGVGFDTAYYHQRRASFEHNDDMASWFAQYMGQPVERMGTLFTSGEMRMYNGDLPERMPDRKFMAVDPAFGGGDAVAAPVCIMYDEDIYIPEVVYSFEGKRISMELLVQAIQKYGIELVQFEANKTLESYVQEFQNLLRERKVRCTVQMKPASANKSKHQRIMDKAPDIRDHMIFLESNMRKKHYQQFIDNVYSFKIYDEKQHDDAPDSLAMAISMVFRFNNNYAYTFKRMF